MNDPYAWTRQCGLTVGVEEGLGRGEQRGKNWDNSNITTKYLINKNRKLIKILRIKYNKKITPVLLLMFDRYNGLFVGE